MNEPTQELSQIGNAVLATFNRIYESAFRGDEAANPNLEVSVLSAGKFSTPSGEQEAFVVLTPWTLNGVLVSGDGLPTTVDIAGHMRQVFEMQAPECGSYSQVNLVPDVSRYLNQRQGLTIAESFIPVWRGALEFVLQS